MLHWYGVGVSQDRVAAYIWSDLAAGRGRGMCAEYGDALAKKRLSNALGQGRSNVTGSRTGFKTRLGISTLGVRNAPIEQMGDVLLGGIGRTNLERIYEPGRMLPARYWNEQDSAWKQGMVEVGEIEPAGPEATKPEAPKPEAPKS